MIPVARAGSFEDFFSAIRNDNASLLASLLNRGFDPNTKDEKGQPGLTIAMQERSPKAADSLLARPDIDVNALNAAGESALMIAAIRGNMPGVQSLLAHGAKVNQPGWSALHYAASGPDVNIVRLLLDRGAEIDAGSPNGSTPLMLAAQYGPEDSVRLLLQRGADVKRRNQLDLGAVDFARKSGRESVVKLIEQALR
jgi:ankyrin repeat protein